MNRLLNAPYRTVLIHLLTWVGILLFPVVVRELFYSDGFPAGIFKQAPGVGDKVVIFCFQLLLIAFFYLNSYVLAPRFFLRRRFAPYLLWLGACFVVLVAVVQGVLSSDLIRGATFFKEKRQFGIFISFLLFALAGLGHRLLMTWLYSEQKQRDLEHEHLKTELSFLQGQINPHFLFNTLNTIYTLSYRQSPKTPDAVLQLSNLLRYVLDTRAGAVALEDEIAHLRDLIALHQLRLSDKTQVHFTVEGDTSGFQIAPLLLMPLVENAFKHGVSSHKPGEIVFILKVVPGKISFHAANPNNQSSGMEAGRKGIGLPNLRRRLELLYPKHELVCDETAEQYIVDLHLYIPAKGAEKSLIGI